MRASEPFPIVEDRAVAPVTLDIGLVNNMPDGALLATEEQFTRLLAAAAGEHVAVRLHRLFLPGLPRGPAAATHLEAHYRDTTILPGLRLDALIVTGCEPRAASLADEPFWPAFTALVDWAEHNTASTFFSCLAAHAAVLHLDGLARRRLPAKRSGVFAAEAAGPHPLLTGVPTPLHVPHSRWNDLSGDELLAHGYTVLTRSPEVGVDAFAKRWRSLFVFVQGHPEYDHEAIGREYRRDITRALRGEQGRWPDLPQHYFSRATEVAFAALARKAEADREAVSLRDLPREVTYRPDLVETWQAGAVPLFRNWLTLVAAERR